MFVNFSGSSAPSSGPDDARQERLRKAILRNRAKRERKVMAEAGSNISHNSNFMGARSGSFTSQLRENNHLPQVWNQPQSQQRRKEKIFSFSFPKIKIPSLTFSTKGKVTKIFAFFCLFLVYQLVFSVNGIIDFYKMERLLASKKQELSEITVSIDNLREEIHLLKNDLKHQKKVAKQELGVLSKDEFLVLFAPAVE
jgi:cell division protein FtsB